MNRQDITIMGVVGGALLVAIVVLITAYINSQKECVNSIVAHTEIVNPTHLTMFTDLELRSDGLYYKIFSNPITTPYTGTVNLRVIDGVLIEVHQSN